MATSIERVRRMTLSAAGRAKLSAAAKAAPRDARGHFVVQEIGRKITVYMRSLPIDATEREAELRKYHTPRSKRYSFRMRGLRPTNRQIEKVADRMEPGRAHFFPGGKHAKPWYQRRRK